MNGLPLGIDFQQIFLHLFNFFILALGLYILLYKPINNFIEKRKAYYDDLDRKIADKDKQSSKILEQNRTELENAGAKIDDMRSKAEKDMEKQAKEIIDQANLKAEEIVKNAKSQALYEKNKMIKEANSEIKEMAINAVKSLLDSKEDVYDEFIKTAKGDSDNENH